MTTPKDAPELAGWMLLTEVAQRAGVARQSVNRWAVAGKFRSLRRLGTQGKKPIYVVSTKEVERLVGARA